MRVTALLFCLLVLLQPYNLPVASELNIIRDRTIESIRIGDPSKNIFTFLKSKYEIKDIKNPRSARSILLISHGEKIIEFWIDSHDRIFLINIFAHYVTPENIGVGSTLTDAVKTYGEATIEPSDPGYFVMLEKLKNIKFLLNNNDLPKNLRNIPDDVFTSEQEKRILAIGKIRISAIQIF